MIRGKSMKKSDFAIDKELVVNANIHNRFDIEVLDAKTGKVKKKAQGFNVICDKLWTTLFNKQKYFVYIHYGDGAGTPSTADTSLFSYIGGQAVDSNQFSFNLNLKTGVFYAKGKIQLTASTAVGKTITEVGIASGSDSKTLCTHAMLQDMNGNPISIAKTDTDVINIYATVYVHFNPQGYDKGTLRFYKYNNYYSLFECLAGQWGNFPTQAYAANTFSPAHEPSGGCYPANLYETSYGVPEDISLTTQFDVATKTIKFIPGRLEASAHNVGGIRAIYITYESGNSYVTTIPQMIIRPGGNWFPESIITNEAVGTGDGVTKDFALDFQYARDATVYVDGVIDEAITVDYFPIYAVSGNYDRCFEFLKPESTIHNHIPDFIRGAAKGVSRYFYNPAAESLGIGTMYVPNYISVSASNDFENWVEVISYTTSYRNNVAVPNAYKHYKYWKVTNNGYDYATSISSVTPAIAHSSKVLHFENPPAAGAVITADYKCDCIAKDANHVFDITITIQLGEYTEAQ